VFFIYANIYLDVKLIYHIVAYVQEKEKEAKAKVSSSSQENQNQNQNHQDPINDEEQNTLKETTHNVSLESNSDNDDESFTLQWLLNSQDQDGNSALHYICSNERHTRDVIITLAKFLLNFPELNKNIQNNNGYTPLMLACYRCNETVAKLLMNHPQVDLLCLSKYRQNALMLACQCRSIVIARRLVELKVDMDVQDNIYGDTALTIVTKYYQSFNILPLLVNKGHANVNIANWKGETPLLLACQANNIEHIQVLVDHGAEVNTLERCDPLRYHDYSKKDSMTMEQKEKEKDKPITTSTTLTSTMTTTKMTTTPITPTTPTTPSTATTEATITSPTTSTEATITSPTITSPITTVATPNSSVSPSSTYYLLDSPFERGQTPLIAAIRNFNYYAMDYLFRHNADPNFIDDEGESPLMATCRAYNKYGSELLLQHQADPDYRNERGESPRSIIKQNQFNFILGI